MAALREAFLNFDFEELLVLSIVQKHFYTHIARITASTLLSLWISVYHWGGVF